MKKRSKRVIKKNFLYVIIYILILIIIIGAVDYKIRPIIKTMSAYQAKVYSNKIVNDAIYEELGKENIVYSNIVNIAYDDNGQVSSLQTDIITLNKLRSRVVNSVINSLKEINNQEIRIPIGTLTGVQFLSGRGHKVLFKIIPTGYVETSLINKFDSAGINQTRHQIMLNLKMTITAIIPGYSTTTDITSNVCLAETVIVGTVPDAFTQVLDDQDVTGKIFDYGADRQ